MQLQYPPRLSEVDASRQFTELTTAALRGVCSRYKLSVPEGVIERQVRHLSACYQEHWRDYHGIRHPVEMLLQAHSLVAVARSFSFAVDWLALELMIAGHDAVIKLGREKGWSERASARLTFELLAELGAPTEFCHLVAVGIRATATHQLPTSTFTDRKSVNTISLLLDLDLAGVGREPAYFQGNTEGVWREFEPVATRAEYNTGRQAWASSFFQSRSGTYLTPFFKGQEAQAKENLRRLAEG